MSTTTSPTRASAASSLAASPTGSPRLTGTEESPPPPREETTHGSSPSRPTLPSPLRQNNITLYTATHETINASLLVEREAKLPKNTIKMYRPRWKEWNAFCEARFASATGFTYAILPHKFLTFMFYQYMREKKGTVGSRRGDRQGFSNSDFEAVIARHSEYHASLLEDPHSARVEGFPQPQNALNYESLCTYRAAIRFLHGTHVLECATNLTWEQINTPAVNDLLNMCKKRGPANKKKNYVEKCDHVSSAYGLVTHFSDIESKVWEHGKGNIKSAFTWLRHRYCLLHSAHGILRCESIFKGELSDCYMVELPCEPQKMWCVSQDLATGKTNQDRKIFGRVMRHKLAELCGVGAFAMYLALRFHITEEFVDYPLANWLDGSKWFDIKLLVDAFN
jgi:Centromere DNA-binding protein complex CBF3 subunit, domain 2